MTWRRFFPKHRIPKDILRLVDAGVLKDETTREDYVPRFETKFQDGSELVLWVDHPDPRRRWNLEGIRYELSLHEPGRSPETWLETNDLDEILLGIAQVFYEKGGPRPIR